VTATSPQQRAAQTRMDRAQLAAVAAEITELRRDLTSLRTRNLAYIAELNKGLGEILDTICPRRRPELRVIVNDGRPRPSQRRPPPLQLVGKGPSS
jgi:hypothetical protein